MLSFVNTHQRNTGAVMSAETVPVPGNEVLPAGSVLLQSLYRHPPGYRVWY
ncbi:hypothetical protein ACIN7338_3279 [Acinetobacter baumannii OIFC338]|nr:hypothetical protein ACIN7338_3279 [Acinetobacter baumannii OIFC338]